MDPYYVASNDLLISVLLTGLGLLFLPMCLISITRVNGLNGLRPATVITAIFESFPRYLVVLLITGLVCFAVIPFLAFYILKPTLGSNEVGFGFGVLVFAFLLFYSLAVFFRILGIFGKNLQAA